MPSKPRLRRPPAWLFAIAMIVIARDLAGAASADLTTLVDRLQRHYVQSRGPTTVVPPAGIASHPPAVTETKE